MKPSALNIAQGSVVVYASTPDLDSLQNHRVITRDGLCATPSLIAETQRIDASSANFCIPDRADAMLQQALTGAAQTAARLNIHPLAST